MVISRITLDKNQIRDYILIGAALVFLTFGKLSGEFPVLIFLGIAPLLALMHNQQKENSPVRSLFLRVYVVFLVAFLCWNTTYPLDGVGDWAFPVIYSIAPLLTCLLYLFTDKHVRSRLGLLTFVIYWLAIEFLMFQVHPQFSRFLLASAFNEHSSLISWNVYTGFMGVSLWVLFVNILFYQALFKNDAVFDGNIRWRKMVLTLLVICLPFFFNNGVEAIIREDLLMNLPAMEKQIAGTGEYIGKTAAWVSILLLLYSFVKREVKKNGRT